MEIRKCPCCKYDATGRCRFGKRCGKTHGCCGPKIDRIEQGLREKRMMQEKSRTELLDMMISLQGLLEEKEEEDGDYESLEEGYDTERENQINSRVGRKSKHHY